MHLSRAANVMSFQVLGSNRYNARPPRTVEGHEPEIQKHSEAWVLRRA